MRRLLPLLLALTRLAAPLAAQERADTVPADTIRADTVEVVTGAPAGHEDVVLPDVSRGTSPGGAFVRALLLPGWGHAAIGAYTRGGFYFAMEGSAGYMLVRTALRKRAAEATRDLRESQARAALAREGVTNPDSITARLQNDRTVADARSLVDSRGQQFQDWMALEVFLVFLSGADAFVSAHLAHFPAPVAVEAAPVSTVGGTALELGFKVPVGPPLGLKLSLPTP